jgi:heme oxygenase
MIMQRLKRDTQIHHEQIERIVDLPSRLRSRAAYQAVLVQFYGFYVPLEASLRQIEGLKLVLSDMAVRQKTDLIARDLLALGVPASELPALPHCADLPALPNVAHALGCLYVLEGATLGGQIIARQLAGGLGMTAASGGAFFSGYGPETGPMWRSFNAGLTAYVTTPEREAEVLTAALETFRAFERWLAGKR